MVLGHPCTPSDQVDQVWHLHLLHTVSFSTGDDDRGSVLDVSGQIVAPIAQEGVMRPRG